MLVEEPNLKKCVINWSVKGPTKNLYILSAEVVLLTVQGGVFPNQLRPIQFSGPPQKSNYEGVELGP